MPRSLHIYFLLAMAAAPLCAHGQGHSFIPASHPHIRYTGRFDHRADGTRFDWPGSAIELRFGGTSCAVKIRGDGGMYNVFINGKRSVARFDTTENIYTLADDLRGDTVHHLKIIKRFEGIIGQINTLKGFFIDGGETLYSLPPRPARRIEFIGGSNLLGFGVEANAIVCDTPALYSDIYSAHGYIAAKKLGAEAHIVAMSGKGMVRNWQTPFVTARRPFGIYYDRTLKNDPKTKWQFDSWTPQVAVVGFGTNDFSTIPHTPKALFKAHYKNFVREIYARYPGVHVVCMTSSREPLKEYVEELVKEWRKEGNGKIHFYSYKQVPMHECGCDWHPGMDAQKKIGEDLAKELKRLFK